MQKSIPLLNNIISETAKKRDAFDASDYGKLRKKLKRNVALRSLLASSEDSANNAADADAEAEENKLRALEEFRNKFVEKLVKA